VVAATILLQRANFIDACYIVAFSLFIYGLSGLTGPRTAVRGNKPGGDHSCGLARNARH